MGLLLNKLQQFLQELLQLSLSFLNTILVESEVLQLIFICLR